jgi:large subunit ribosomal protein L25
MTALLKAELRTDSTKSYRRQLRNTGKVPAVVYGKKITPIAIFLDEKELTSMLKGNAHGVIQMDVPGQGVYPVLLGEIQRDTMLRKVTHVDFRQISMDEPIKTSVVVELSGDCPGEREGGMLTLLLHELEIRCLPKDVPASISVDVTKLEIGESVLVSDLPIPSGVEVRTDASNVVVTVLAPQKDRGAEETKEVANEVAKANQGESVPANV